MKAKWYLYFSYLVGLFAGYLIYGLHQNLCACAFAIFAMLALHSTQKDPEVIL